MQWSINSARGNALSGQFATPNWVANILSARLLRVPKRAVDLGVGRGALSIAMRNRFQNLPIIGIDKYVLPQEDRLLMLNEGMQLITRDVGEVNFSNWFRKRFGRVGTVVSNPPFIYVSNLPETEQLL